MCNFKRIIFLSSLILTGFVFANPSSPTVISGDVKIDDVLNKTLQIHASDQSIINWKDFSIDIEEITKFIQPDKTSAVLNRVLGENASNILGKLEANGHVFLINPNGIIFGKDAQIDTAAFTASTLNLLDEDFLKKSELLFEGTSKATIINLGKINTTCGDVTLLGYKVENHGEINCQKGIAALGVGRKILLKPSEREKIYICLQDKMEEKEEKGLINTGKINAISAELKADGNPYMYAINLEGVIEANGFEEKDGKVFIVAEDGRAEVTGQIFAKNADETGGEVRVLGKAVILNHAIIDATAEKGEGIVLIGGDYKGENSDITNAELVYVSLDSVIDVSAKDKGKGGKVILWADKQNSFYGSIFAKGGKASGDGGFVEVSSKGNLFPEGKVSTKAFCGNDGILLLDPVDINVSAAVDAGISYPPLPAPPPPPGFGPYTYVFNATPVTINSTTLAAFLSDNNVTINTSSEAGGPFPGAGNVTFLQGTTWTGPNTFTVIADNDIILNAGVTLWSQSGGSVNLIANNDIIFGPAARTLNQAGGNVAITANRNIDFRGLILGNTNNITFNSMNGNIIFGDGFNPGRVMSFPGNVFINAYNGDFHLIGGTINGASFIVRTSGDIVINVAGNVLMQGGAGSGYGSYLATPDRIIIGDTIIPQNMTMMSGTGLNTHAQIVQASTCVINVANTFTIDGTPAGANSFAEINVQDLTLNCTDMFMTGYTNVTSSVGDVRLLAGDSITLTSNASGNPDLSSSGTGLYIVVDNNFPTPPDLGLGALNVDGSSVIHTLGGAPLYIYTAIRDQNVINGLIQGAAFVPGAEYVDSATEMWGTYYPFVVGGIPYTIFYKDSGTFDLAMEQGGAALSEVYSDNLLHSFNEYINAYMQFFMQLKGMPKAERRTINSFDFPYKRGLFLRKRTEPNEERIIKEEKNNA